MPNTVTSPFTNPDGSWCSCDSCELWRSEHGPRAVALHDGVPELNVHYEYGPASINTSGDDEGEPGAEFDTSTTRMVAQIEGDSEPPLCVECDRNMLSAVLTWWGPAGTQQNMCRTCRGGSNNCDNCGFRYPRNDAQWNYETGSCRNCASEVSQRQSHERGVIQSWDYRPMYRLTGSDWHMGMEIEIDNLDDRTQAAEHVAKTSNLVYVKGDGSLDYGIEAVTHPGDLEAWQTGVMIDWQKWKESVRDMLPAQEDVHSSGVHIHVERTAFDGGSHVWKFGQLQMRNAMAFQILAGRGSTTYANWNEESDRTDTLFYAALGLGEGQLQRYNAINFQNDATVEVRYFDSTLSQVKLLSYIELMHATVEYTRQLTVGDVRDKALSWERFIAWVEARRNQYRALLKRVELNPSLTERNDTYRKEFDAERGNMKAIQKRAGNPQQQLADAWGVSIKPQYGKPGQHKPDSNTRINNLTYFNRLEDAYITTTQDTVQGVPVGSGDFNLMIASYIERLHISHPRDGADNINRQLMRAIERTDEDLYEARDMLMERYPAVHTLSNFNPYW